MAQKAILLFLLVAVICGTVLAQDLSNSPLCLMYMDDYLVTVMRLDTQEVIFRYPEEAETLLDFAQHSEYPDTFVVQPLEYTVNSGIVQTTLFRVTHSSGIAIEVEGDYAGSTVNENGEILVSYITADFQYRLAYFNPETGDTMLLLPNGIYPSWGPRGSFSIQLEDSSLVMVTGRGDMVEIAHSGAFAVWSPSGEKIAYVEYPSGNIVVKNAETGTELWRTENGFHAWQPVWLDESVVIATGETLSVTSRTNLIRAYTHNEETGEITFTTLLEGSNRYRTPQVYDCQSGPGEQDI